MVPRSEIADPKNGYNLNLPRYIDSTAPEDLQDIDGHLRGGIPERDLDDPDNALAAYWAVLPNVRATLFESAGRPGYARLKLALTDVKPAIFGNAEFTAFNQTATQLFTHWRCTATQQLTAFGQDGHPKALIEATAEALLTTFKAAKLLDAYDIYQHLMDYWATTLQDDAYLIAADGWVKGVQPREVKQAKDKNNKLVWPEPHDYVKGKRRFKSDLVPATILVAKYFAPERAAIDALNNLLATLEQQLNEMLEEHSGEDGLLAEVIEGEGDKQKISAKAVKARLKLIGQNRNDPDYADERKALTAYADVLDQQLVAKFKLKTAQDELDKKIDAQYPLLTEAQIKTLVVDDKWMAYLSTAIKGELDRVSQTLTGRLRELAERYATPLPQLTDEVATLAARVEEHLKRMGATWN